MSVRTISTPSIALIKYWGNRNDALRLPMADSVSITLDRPSVEVTAEHAEKFTVKSLEQDGSERTLTNKEHARLEKHFLISKEYLNTICATPPFSASISLQIRSQIPKSIGLASSSAVFSALAEAYASFAPPISRRDVSVIARLGSGSASRSVYGGFVAMTVGEGGTVNASYSEQIASADHWKLWDIIIVPSRDEKETGSTEGHALAVTSPLYAARIRAIPARKKRCVDAILRKNFAKLREVSEEDCLNMHEVMESSNPPLRYLSEETHRIVADIKALRSRSGINVLYTMDAGATVHLICDEAAVETVREYANRQKNCTIFETKIGGGSRCM